jgi:glycosyltransferase involved in cell wall biosynthesis
MPEQLRVVFVVGPTSGGIGRHVHAISRSLIEQQHQVTVVAPPQTLAMFDWHSLGATFVPAPVGATGPRALATAVRTVATVAASADVVHAHGARAGAVSVLARAHPLVVTWHNTKPASLRRRWAHPVAERVAARGAQLTLAVSPDLAARARRAGATEVRLVAVPAPQLPPLTRDRSQVRAELGVGDRPLVLAVARLERQKRLDLLVEATTGWTRRPDRPVVAVAGVGSLADALERRARAVESPLSLLGRREDVADLLNAADVAVLSSDWEGYPLIAQEALRAGVPLVATAVGGVPALVGGAAALVPAGDAEALGACLDELLRDPGKRAQMSAAGVERARRWPTLEATVIDLVREYQSLSLR